jgi:hypothetical protein
MMDYTGKSNPAAYADACDKLTIYIGKKYGHNGHIFDNLEEFPFEGLAPVDDDDFLPENDPHGLVLFTHKEEIKTQLRLESNYELNKVNVYAIIWGQCTLSLQREIMDSEDYKTFYPIKDCLALWKRIQEVLLTGAGVNDNEILKKRATKKEFSIIKQSRGESVEKFYKRYLIHIKALEAGGIDVPEQNELAIDFLFKLDPTIFGKMVTNLENRQIDGFDEWPTTLAEAMTRANNRKVYRDPYASNNHQNMQQTVFAATTPHVDNRKKNNNRFNNSNHSNISNGDSNSKSHNSNKRNDKSDDSNRNKKDNSRERYAVTCWTCGKNGHVRRDCPTLISAKHAHHRDDDVNIVFHADTNIVAASMSGRLGPYDILCDNQATVAVFHQRELLSNVREADQSISIHGMGGKVEVNLVGDYDWYGKVYYSPSSPANILCFHDLNSRFDVSFDGKKNMFIVKNDDDEYLFKGKNKLYIYDPLKHHDFNHIENNNSDVALVQTVESNEMLYTKRQVEDAKLSRTIMKRLGYPSIDSMIRGFANGAVLNSPITAADIHRASKIYGTDLATLKGKTVTVKSIMNKIEEAMPKVMNADIILCVDLIFINGLCFLITVSEDLGLLMTQYLASRSIQNLKTSLDDMISTYRSENFTVKCIKTDGEGAIGALKSHLNDQGIVVNTSSKNQHVPQIERKARQIKERVRAHIAVLPFKLTTQLLICLVYFCVQSINLFAQRTQNHCMSPREMFTGRKLDLKRDCKIEFGEYAQIHEDNIVKNNMQARTSDAIAVRMRGNNQGTVEFLSLSTWKIVSRDRWTSLPMPRSVIDQINMKADREKSSGIISSNDLNFRFSNGMIVANEDMTEIVDGVTNNDVTEGMFTSNLREIPVVPRDDDSQRVFADPVLDAEIVSADDIDMTDRMNDIDFDSQNDFPPEFESENVDSRGVVVLEDDPLIDDVDVNPVNLVPMVDPMATISAMNRYNLRPRRAQPGRWDEKDFNDVYFYESLSKDDFHEVYFHESLKSSVQKSGKVALQSIFRELKQMVDKNVWRPVIYDDLSFSQRKSVIRSRMFIKHKSDGVVKARLVAGGHMQDKSIYEDLSSPTVATQSVFMIAAIAQYEKRLVYTVDIEGAYLNASMGKHEVIMKMDNYLSELLVELYPEYKEYSTYKGEIFVILNKALYGCVESARLFYLHVKNSLNSFGYTSNSYDDCVFNITENDIQCTIAVHVDDLLITCKSQAMIDKLIDNLTRVYKKIKVNEGSVQPYLGMIFDFHDDYVKLDMKRFIQEILDEYPVEGEVTSPAANHLFDIDEFSPKLDQKRKELFHTLTAKLLYLSKRARPELSTAISFLTTRVLYPTEQDNIKLERVIKYLSGSVNIVMRLAGSKDNQTKGYIDASFAVHPQMQSHTGGAISTGKGIVDWKSSRQQLMSKSSAEAELIGLSDYSSRVIWTRNWNISQGYEERPAVIYQDNQSTIALVEKGKSTSQRTRHVSIRYFFLKDRIDSHEIEIRYLPTDVMLADIFTKPLQGKKFVDMRKELMNLE